MKWKVAVLAAALLCFVGGTALATPLRWFSVVSVPGIYELDHAPTSGWDHPAGNSYEHYACNGDMLVHALAEDGHAAIWRLPIALGGKFAILFEPDPSTFFLPEHCTGGALCNASVRVWLSGKLRVSARSVDDTPTQWFAELVGSCSMYSPPLAYCPQWPYSWK